LKFMGFSCGRLFSHVATSDAECGGQQAPETKLQTFHGLSPSALDACGTQLNVIY
jgi:hypothetical protein